MTYENKAFPLASGTAYNHYGQRGLQDGKVSGGSLPKYGGEGEAVVYVTGKDFADGDSFSTRLVLPKGAFISEVFAETEEAFALGGTTPTIDVGVAGTEGTNTAVSISESDAETAGTLTGNSTPAGTLGSPLTADTAIGVALGGTSPTATSAGRIKVVIRYDKI